MCTNTIIGKNKNDADMPDEAVLAALAGIDNIKVDKLVNELLNVQSLKVLPQALFGDAMKQFVHTHDKSIMESFVKDNLTEQINGLLLQEVDDEDQMEDAMAKHRDKLEKAFKASGGVSKRSAKPKRKGKLLPRPGNWDSDLDGEWEDSPTAYASPDEDEDEPVKKPAAKRGKAAVEVSDDDASIASAPASKSRKAPAKKAAAKPRAPAKPKAPAKATGRGKKKTAEPSDHEDDDFEMIDAPPPGKSQPKRAAATKGRQSTINFSQSQAKPSTGRELSDDEISDDDDAFEPIVSSSRRK